MDNVKDFRMLYATLWKYFEALSVVAVMMYISAFDIIRDKSISYQYKILVLSSVVLLFCMPIGSNVGIPHLCNELFIAMPFIFMFVQGKILSNTAIKERNIKIYLSLEFIIWVSVLSLNQAFYRSNYIKDRSIINNLRSVLS